MTQGKTKLDKSAQAEARKQSDQKKLKAWADLREDNHKDYTLRRFRIFYIKMVKERLEMFK